MLYLYIDYFQNVITHYTFLKILGSGLPKLNVKSNLTYDKKSKHVFLGCTDEGSLAQAWHSMDT